MFQFWAIAILFLTHKRVTLTVLSPKAVEAKPTFVVENKHKHGNSKNHGKDPSSVSERLFFLEPKKNGKPETW